MKKDPTLFSGSFDGFNVIAEGGLHYIRGNSAPHFSLTGSIFKNGVWVGGGCCHDEILACRPEYQDFADIHLSDWRGVPMHGAGNAWYFARGGQWLGDRWLSALDSRYASDGSKMNEEAPFEWRRDRIKSILRCDDDTASRIAWLGENSVAQDIRQREIKAAEKRYALEASSGIAVDVPTTTVIGYKAMFESMVEPMYERWQREAIECVRKHRLSLYGDLNISHERLLARMERGDFSLPSQHDLEQKMA